MLSSNRQRESVDMEHIGYRTLANDYLACVAYLQDACETNALKLRFDSPVLANLAHAAELAIKGHLLSLAMSKDDVINLGHDLELAYQRLKTLSPNLVSDIEKQVITHWKGLLRGKRDEREKSFIAFGIHDPDNLRKLGVFSNAEIGDELPTFQRDLKWLSDRHKAKGGEFRYFETRMDRRQHIQAFGLNLFTVPVSIVTGTKILIDRIA